MSLRRERWVERRNPTYGGLTEGMVIGISMLCYAELTTTSYMGVLEKMFNAPLDLKDTYSKLQ